MKTAIIAVMLVLILGFYFFPADTKGIVDTTGNFLKEKAKGFAEKIENSSITEEITSENISNISNITTA